MSRLPHFLDSRLIDGHEDVSLKRRPPSNRRKIPCTHFCYRLSRPQDHSAAERIRSIKKSNYFIGNRTRTLPGSNIVHEPNTLQLAHFTCLCTFYYMYYIRACIQKHVLYGRFKGFWRVVLTICAIRFRRRLCNLTPV
jgi:hypothetical protein